MECVKNDTNKNIFIRFNAKFCTILKDKMDSDFEFDSY